MYIYITIHVIIQYKIDDYYKQTNQKIIWTMKTKMNM